MLTLRPKPFSVNLKCNFCVDIINFDLKNSTHKFTLPRWVRHLFLPCSSPFPVRSDFPSHGLGQVGPLHSAPLWSPCRPPSGIRCASCSWLRPRFGLESNGCGSGLKQSWPENLFSGYFVMTLQRNMEYGAVAKISLSLKPDHHYKF